MGFIAKQYRQEYKKLLTCKFLKIALILIKIRAMLCSDLNQRIK